MGSIIPNAHTVPQPTINSNNSNKQIVKLTFFARSFQRLDQKNYDNFNFTRSIKQGKVWQKPSTQNKGKDMQKVRGREEPFTKM